MNRRELLQAMSAAAIVSFVSGEAEAMAASGETVYELRMYHAMEGKRDALVARFRDHTDALFKKHGLKPVAYWNPTDEPVKGNTFIYILKHPSREAATANWKSFHDEGVDCVGGEREAGGEGGLDVYDANGFFSGGLMLVQSGRMRFGAEDRR
jgi:NIPSNAP protein